MKRLQRLSLPILLVVVLTLCISPALAQAATPITYGDTVEGTLANKDARLFYEFDAEAGDTISISTESGADLQVTVTLSDSNAQELDSTDHGQGAQPPITKLYLPLAGTYTITALPRSGTGSFTLTLERTSSADERVTLYEEDFDDNSADWEVGGNGIIDANIQDGQYVIQATCDQSNPLAWFGAPGLNDGEAVPQFDSNYVADVEVKVYEGEGSARVGLMFGVQQPGYQTMNILYYDTEGYWNYRYAPSAGLFNESGANQTEAVEIADGEWHHLGMSVTDAEVRLWVDGHQVADIIPQKDSVKGTIGLAGGCGAFNTQKNSHIEYDNLVVTAAPEQAE